MTLTVTTTHGSDVSDVTAISVTATVAPVASFTTDVTAGFAPLAVAFTNTSSVGTGVDVTYLWNFGNEVTSTEENPTYSYDVAGDYDVTLTVTTTHGTDVSDVTVISALSFYGDVDQNGSVASWDGAQILKWLVDYVELTEQQLLNADVNLSEAVTALDATIILQYMVGTVVELPYLEGFYVASGDIDFPNQEVEIGQLVEVPIYVADPTNIFSFESTISFDTEFLTFEGIDWSFAQDTFTFKEVNDEVNGEIKIAAADSQNLVLEGEEFAVVKFIVNVIPENGVDVTLNHHWNDEIFTTNVANLDAPYSAGEDEVMNMLKLNGNYPNPFCNETTISYSLKSGTDSASLEIYNMKGQLVDNVSLNVNETSVVWNSDKFTSGIYFYKMKANGRYTSTKKMILLK